MRNTAALLALLLMAVAGCGDDGAGPTGNLDLGGAVDQAGMNPDLFDPNAWRIEPACPQVTVRPPPAALGVSAFYAKWVDSGGIPILASSKVSDAALGAAHYVLANELAARPCVRAALRRAGVRFVVMSPTEMTLDVPEHSDLMKAFPQTDWNARARGLGATWVRPATSVGEENLLRKIGDRYRGESIAVHEFSHAWFEFGIEGLVEGEDFRARLGAAFRNAQDTGLWKDTYALTNENEYWAEGVQDWFDTNLTASPPNGIHNEIDTRDELEKYDPSLFALLGDAFGPRRFAPFCSTAPGAPAWTDPTPATVDEAACQFARATLGPGNCAAAAGAKSIESKTAATITFVNRRYTPVTVEWLDFNGAAMGYGTVGARSQRSLSTFATHAWRLSDAGNCVTFGVTAPVSTYLVAE